MAGCVNAADLKIYLLLLASTDNGCKKSTGGQSNCPHRLRGMLLRTLPYFAGPRLPEATQRGTDALSDFAWSSSRAAAAARGDGEQNWKAQSRRELPDMPPPPAFFCFGGFGTNLESKGGIELPFRDWPFENEYQFAFWVRFESFSHNVTTLFALASEADCSGITLTVDQGGNLNIRVGDSGLIAIGGSPNVRCGTLRSGMAPYSCHPHASAKIWFYLHAFCEGAR